LSQEGKPLFHALLCPTILLLNLRGYHYAMSCMFTAGLLISLSVPLMGAGDDLSLRGVKVFKVIVEDIPKNAPGLTPDDLQTDVELRCRKAGIKLENSPGVYLYINVGLQELFYANGRSEGVYGVSIGVEFKQPVLLERDPAVHVIATTWSTRSVGTVDARDLYRAPTLDKTSEG
jgi:hypothetical protein